MEMILLWEHEQGSQRQLVPLRSQPHLPQPSNYKVKMHPQGPLDLSASPFLNSGGLGGLTPHPTQGSEPLLF